MENEYYGPPINRADEVPPTNSIPSHVVLKIFATSLAHFNLSKAEGGVSAAAQLQQADGDDNDDFERHGVVMKM